ncbi:DMT family transporter [Aureivirga sp. CE67]|uniref:DMT family transporter n=1 Tax=Aureivirga sp. CE67 TaxID=1788983 RepID=UPI0018CB4B2D|nr:DMT family transporter [Aureivirga sp. CE67]
MPKSNLKHFLHLHLIVFIWGFTALLGDLISLEALPLVWFRMFLAVGFIYIYFLYKKKKIAIDKKAWIKFLIGGIIIALHWITFFHAIKVSNISVVLVTLSTGAFFASILEPIFFKRKIQPLELFFGSVVILGLYVIFNLDTDYTLGIIYALISAFLSALFSVINGLYVKKYEPSIISFYQLLLGVGFVTIFLGVTGGFHSEFFALEVSDWIYLFILSSVCTAYAFIGSVKVMQFLTPYTVMLTINLEPVYGIILAVLVFPEKEKMDASFYIGAAIIILVVLLNGIIKNRKEKAIQKKQISL